jgi:hypothetical protein
LAASTPVTDSLKVAVKTTVPRWWWAGGVVRLSETTNGKV